MELPAILDPVQERAEVAQDGAACGWRELLRRQLEHPGVQLRLRDGMNGHTVPSLPMVRDLIADFSSGRGGEIADVSSPAQMSEPRLGAAQDVHRSSALETGERGVDWDAIRKARSDRLEHAARCSFVRKRDWTEFGRNGEHAPVGSEIDLESDFTTR
ncbi:MAG TPA: hypothetical protein VKM54_19530 [Myxococcota bacterium]|nr:hypothetical protein [Myxococcota bacterium]